MRDEHTPQARLQRARRAAAWTHTRPDRGPAATLAELHAVQAEIVRLKEAEARAIPRNGPVMPKPRSHAYENPCVRCDHSQPRGQTDEAIAAFLELNPTAVLHMRADGIYRAHTSTCDAIPQRPPVAIPPLHPDDAITIRGDNRGLSHDRDGKAIAEPDPAKYAEHVARKALALGYVPRR